jgi:ATP-dependent 26S proteasome regulatory subunit
MHLSISDIEELVRVTRGFSGADLKNLSVEAAMIPLRSI